MTTTDPGEPGAVQTPTRAWMTTKQASDYSGYHQDTILKRCREYELSGHQRGIKNSQPTPNATRKIHVDDLLRWMEGEKPSKGVRRHAA